MIRIAARTIRPKFIFCRVESAFTCASSESTFPRTSSITSMVKGLYEYNENFSTWAGRHRAVCDLQAANEARSLPLEFSDVRAARSPVNLEAQRSFARRLPECW